MSPPSTTSKLVVDTDVASSIFKWHPEFAPRYLAIIRGSELVVSFMTLAEIRQGAIDANWGQRKQDLLEAYLADFSVLHSDSQLCSTWAEVDMRAHARAVELVPPMHGLLPRR